MVIIHFSIPETGYSPPFQYCVNLPLASLKLCRPNIIFLTASLQEGYWSCWVFQTTFLQWSVQIFFFNQNLGWQPQWKISVTTVLRESHTMHFQDKLKGFLDIKPVRESPFRLRLLRNTLVCWNQCVPSMYLGRISFGLPCWWEFLWVSGKFALTSWQLDETFCY